MIGKTLQNGKYEIIRVLGQGGFGITYEGVQTALERKVAIKEFFIKDFCERDEGTSHVTLVGTEGNRNLVKRFMEKFIKEAQMIAGLEDVPHIIRIYDIFQENGTAYYVMQYIEGGSLDDLMKKNGALSETVAIGYVRQIAEALGNLHKQRIMHLDIKPSNILLRGEDLFLIDFGVSKHYDAEGDATTTTPVGRSKGYAPIEQYRQGGVLAFSPETDIYSLGATTYFLVTGHTPPEATELVEKPLKRPDGISDGLWNAINAAMSPNKNNRPHSIAEFMDLFENRSERSTESAEADSETTTIDFGGNTSNQDVEPIQEELYVEPDVKKEPVSDRHVQTPVSQPKRPDSKFWKYGIVAVVMLSGMYIAYNWNRTPSEKHHQIQSEPNNTTEPAVQAITVEGYGKTVSFTMKKVEAGSFQMGSKSGEYNEEPVHGVTISKDYYMGETEVTQALWYAVIGQSPTSDGSKWTSTYGKGDDYPAYYISYEDCQEFIQKLNEKTGKNFRMPTEAEWEFAARGGNKTNNCTYAGSNNINKVAWYDINSWCKGSNSPDYGTHPVRMKQANELGLYDMSGNVWEWCYDWSDSYSSSSQTDPTGPSSGSYRVSRGGSWGSSAEYCRSAGRNYNTPTIRSNYLGFRLAL